MSYYVLCLICIRQGSKDSVALALIMLRSATVKHPIWIKFAMP